MSKNQIPLGVVGADGLQFLAVLGQFNGFFGCKDDSFTVPLFLDCFQKINSKKYDSRSQIITKLNIKLMKNCPLCYDLSWNNDNDNCPVQHKLVWYKSSRTVYFSQSMVQYGIMGHWISFPFFVL